MTDYAYVTQEMWDRSQTALRAALPIIEAHTPLLSTAGTMVSLRDQVIYAIGGAAPDISTVLADKDAEIAWLRALLRAPDGDG